MIPETIQLQKNRGKFNKKKNLVKMAVIIFKKSWLRHVHYSSSTGCGFTRARDDNRGK